MKIRPDTWDGITTTYIYPWLAEDATAQDMAFNGHIVAREGAISINATMKDLSVDETLTLIDALQKAIEIAQQEEQS